MDSQSYYLSCGQSHTSLCLSRLISSTKLLLEKPARLQHPEFRDCPAYVSHDKNPTWSLQPASGALSLHLSDFSHSQVVLRTDAVAVSPLGADLQYSHISIPTPLLLFMSPPLLFSVCVCWKPWVIPGATGAPGCVLCSSQPVLLVTGAPRVPALRIKTGEERTKQRGCLISQENMFPSL